MDDMTHRFLPQAVQRLDDALFFAGDDAVSLFNATPSAFCGKQPSRKTRLLAFGALCTLGWWWLTGQECELPDEVPADFADNASRCMYLAERLEGIGVVGSELLVKALPLGEIHDDSAAAHSALYHWFDILRAQPDSRDDVLRYLKGWLIDLEAATQIHLNARHNFPMVLYTK